MEQPSGIITLTTDFGNSDGFVGAMKGVILRRFPSARLVDIAHDLPRQDIRAAALVLLRACLEFPPGTIHLAVIDPGVGSEREGIIVETSDYCFVLPDNGLISLIAQNQKIVRIHCLHESAYRLASVSNTFHGRDVFAPAAAYAASGIKPQAFGPALSQPVLLNWPICDIREDGVYGEITAFDTYGNAMTNIPNDVVNKSAWRLKIQDLILFGPSSCYADVDLGQVLFLKGSMGFLEISIREGSVRDKLELTIGNTMVLKRSKQERCN